MKLSSILLVTLISTSIFAADGIIESSKNLVESQYGLKCGDAIKMKQSFFKPIRHREEISCKDANNLTQLVIQTEAKAQGEPLHNVQIIAANPDFVL